MANEIAKVLGSTVKMARKQKQFTQLQLSQKVHISRNYISDIECGRYIPSFEKLLLLSDILNIDLNSLKNDGNTNT